MATQRTREEVETLVRQANSPDPSAAADARAQLVALSKNLDTLPDEAVKAWVSEVVRDWISRSG